MSIRRAAPLLLALLLYAWPRGAAAQACCAATTLISPARLQGTEQFGAGLRVRGRGIVGAFAADGRYQTASLSDGEVGQDLFAVVRAGINGQLAVLLPFQQTHRSVGGLSSWGGGVGDLALSGRYVLLLPGERALVPGLALQASISVPTGRAATEARDTLATDATGTGSFEGTVGFDLQQVAGPWFVAFDGWISQRVPRSSPPISQSFAPRLTAAASAGHVFANDLSVGLFITGFRQGESHDGKTNRTVEGSAVSLCSAGAGVVVPARDWRLQATASLDVLISGLGRNQLAGAGLSVSAARLWN